MCSKSWVQKSRYWNVFQQRHTVVDFGCYNVDNADILNCGHSHNMIQARDCYMYRPIRNININLNNNFETRVHCSYFMLDMSFLFHVRLRSAVYLPLKSLFSALHVMQTRYSEENSVCPSVCLSVCLSVTHVIPDKTEERSVEIYIPHERIFILVF